MNTPPSGGFPPPRPKDAPPPDFTRIAPPRTTNAVAPNPNVQPQTTAERLRPSAPTPVRARKPKPLPPYVPTEKALQREYFRASLATPWYLGGPNIFRGLILAYPRPFGLFLLALGVLCTGLRIAHIGAPPGTTLVILGAGLVASSWIPIDRPWGRLAGYGVSLMVGIVVDERLRGVTYFL